MKDLLFFALESLGQKWGRAFCTEKCGTTSPDPLVSPENPATALEEPGSRAVPRHLGRAACPSHTTNSKLTVQLCTEQTAVPGRAQQGLTACPSSSRACPAHDASSRPPCWSQSAPRQPPGSPPCPHLLVFARDPSRELETGLRAAVSLCSPAARARAFPPTRSPAWPSS